MAKKPDYIMLQKFCFWLEFWSKNKQHTKILFALSISRSCLEFEIPFDLVYIFILACLPDTFSGPSGIITYPQNGELYDRNIKCFFKITVAAGQKVKIKFEQFDFAPGYNYNIERRNSDSTAITKKFVGDNFQGM